MTRSHKLFLTWLLQSSLILFLIYFLSDQGIIFKIVSSDKSYITTLIMLVYIIVTIHCVYHTFLISKELNKAHIIKKSLIKENVKLRIIESNLILTSKGEISDGIVSHYFKDLIGLKKNGATSHVQILDSYKKKIQIYDEGIKSVEKFIKEYQVDCEWNACGKFFASSQISDEKIVTKFSKLLSSLNFNNQILYK